MKYWKIPVRLFLFLLLLPFPLKSDNSKQCDQFAPTLTFNQNFQDSGWLKGQLKPYVIPSDHLIKPALDAIFQTSRVTHSKETLIAAGFIIHTIQMTSNIIVSRHPQVPGYVFKIYLDTDPRTRKGKEGWQWLVSRCKSAATIRNLIKKNKITKFSVPDKWIYLLPEHPSDLTADSTHQPAILIATDMKLVPPKESAEAWRKNITPQHLNELYIILSHGYGSTFLVHNVPYTASGKFSFVDTEYPKRKFEYEKVKRFLSPEMCKYWDKLVRKAAQ